MALHAQQQIIDWFGATLLAGSTDAAANVFTDRLDPLTGEQIPAIDIEGGDETVEPYTIENMQLRDFNVLVKCTVAQVSGYEEAARALGLQVEKLVAAPPARAGGLCLGGVSITSNQLAKAGEGDTAVAAVVQTWSCKYIVRAHEPDTPL